MASFISVWHYNGMTKRIVCHVMFVKVWRHRWCYISRDVLDWCWRAAFEYINTIDLAAWWRHKKHGAYVTRNVCFACLTSAGDQLSRRDSISLQYLFVFIRWHKLWLIYHFSQFLITMDITQCTLFFFTITLKVGFPLFFGFIIACWTLGLNIPGVVWNSWLKLHRSM